MSQPWQSPGCDRARARFRRSTRLILAVFAVVTAIGLVGALVHERWRSAFVLLVMFSVTPAFILLVFWVADRHLRRPPRWSRGVPAEVLNDPARRFEVARRSWQVRGWLIGGVVLFIFAIVIGIAHHNWAALIIGVVGLGASIRPLLRVFGKLPPPRNGRDW